MKLKVLVVVVVESGKGVVRERQYAQVRTTRIHLKLAHLKGNKRFIAIRI